MAAALAVALAPAPGYADPTPADVDRDAAVAWQQLEIVVEHYNGVRENLRATQGQLDALRAELAPVRQRMDELRRSVGAMAAGVYMTGAGNYTALLSAGSPRLLLDQLTTLSHLARRQQAEIAALRRETDRYDASLRAVRALAAQQSAQYAELAAQKMRIEKEIARLRALGARLPVPRASRGAGRDRYRPVFPADAGGAAVRFAYRQIGKVYRYAADGPEAYDCSGLTMASWLAAGVRLPHNAAMQWRTVRHISRAELRPGDLVFYYRDIHHVALYAGDGHVIEAPRVGDVVSVRRIDVAPIHGYGRV